jgi:parvulin-like peptidyl-prolyl isomerase
MLIGLIVSIMLVVGCGSKAIPATTESPVLPDSSTPVISSEQEAQPPTPTPVPPTPTTEPLAAVVNGEKITLAEYERQIALYEVSMANAGQDPTTEGGQKALAEARVWILDQMIDQILIKQAAAEAGITISEEEVDSTIASLKQEIGEEALLERVQNEGMTLEEMRAQLHREMVALKMMNYVVEQVPLRTEHVQARHILFSNEEEARQVLAQLRAGADFATFARTYSEDASTRDFGGDLGYFPRGILTSPEVETVAFELQPGQISDVVQSALGYHIIQVLDRKPDMEVDPENLRLLQASARSQWLEDLRAQASIQRYLTPTP